MTYDADSKSLGIARLKCHHFGPHHHLQLPFALCALGPVLRWPQRRKLNGWDENWVRPSNLVGNIRRYREAWERQVPAGSQDKIAWPLIQSHLHPSRRRQIAFTRLCWKQLPITPAFQEGPMTPPPIFCSREDMFAREGEKKLTRAPEHATATLVFLVQVP